MFYPDYSMNFRERKKARSDYYHKFVEGKKLEECIACSGGCYYCGKPCASCQGTGKVREGNQ